MGTRSASLIVVINGFQPPSLEVAEAAYGVARSKTASALDCRLARAESVMPGRVL